MAQSSYHILVIDDDRLVLRVTREVLEADGHRVITADNGQAGIDVFLLKRQSGDSFHLVITDFNMPDMEGDKVAGILRESCPEVSIILLTASSDPKDLARIPPALFDLILTKPCSAGDLRNAILQCRQKTRVA